MVDHLTEGESVMTVDDLANYQATIEEALATPYGDAVIYSTGKATGGTTISESLRLIAGFDVGSLEWGSPDYLHVLAECFKTAFADRFAYLADPDKQESPWQALLTPDYIESRRCQIDRERATPARAGDQICARHHAQPRDLRARLHE